MTVPVQVFSLMIIIGTSDRHKVVAYIVDSIDLNLELLMECAPISVLATKYKHYTIARCCSTVHCISNFLTKWHKLLFLRGFTEFNSGPVNHQSRVPVRQHLRYFCAHVKTMQIQACICRNLNKVCLKHWESAHNTTKCKKVISQFLSVENNIIDSNEYTSYR